MATASDLLHFVGSIPLKDSEEVFSRLSREVGPWLRRMPDGETGERLAWIRFQQRMLSEHPAMEVDRDDPPLPVKQSDGSVLRDIRRLRLKPGIDPDSVQFDTGYERAALGSWQVFRELKEKGMLPPVRFQFALPTPLASGLMYVSPNGRERYVRAYERSLMSALARIVSGIPAQDLAIQFDVCQEVLQFEGYFPEREPGYKAAAFSQFSRLAAAVPQQVELGFHLCYGSPGDQPLLRLGDASVLVELMNGIENAVSRKVDFIHVPVPKSAGEPFFEPFRAWRNAKGTRLYLGLLQYDDAAGDERRIAAARRVVRDFGAGAECGFGRTDPARVPAILAGHRRAAQLLQRP
jgi:hypothetical protein